MFSFFEDFLTVNSILLQISNDKRLSWLVGSETLNCSLWIINLNLTSAPSWGVQKIRCPSFNLELSKQISLTHILIEHKIKITCSNQKPSKGGYFDPRLIATSLEDYIGKPETKPSGKETGGIKLSLLALHWWEECKSWLVMGCLLSEFLSSSFLSRLLVTPCDTGSVRGPGGEKKVKMYSWLDRGVIAGKEQWRVPGKVM